MVLSNPSQIECNVTTSMSSLMALRVVATMQGESGWQLDQGQSGSAGEETWDTLRVLTGLSVDILTLDIVGVIVILAVEVMAEVLVLQRVSMSWMATSSRFELMEFVSGVERIVYEDLEFEGHQSDCW
jgi:hypothetical protein